MAGNDLSFAVTVYGEITTPRSSELEFLYLCIWRKYARNSMADIHYMVNMVKGYYGQESYARDSYTRNGMNVKMTCNSEKWKSLILEDHHSNVWNFWYPLPEFKIFTEPETTQSTELKSVSLVDREINAGFNGVLQHISDNGAFGIKVPFTNGKLNGKLKRWGCTDNGLNGAIVVSNPNICEVHYKDGILHRNGNEPAVIYKASHSKIYEYYVNGVRHRENGPAIIFEANTFNGPQFLQYRRNGKAHNDNGAASILYSIDRFTNTIDMKIMECYCINGDDAGYPSVIINDWTKREKAFRFITTDKQLVVTVTIAYKCDSLNFEILMRKNDRVSSSGFNVSTRDDARVSLHNAIDDERIVSAVMKYLNLHDADFLKDPNAPDFEGILEKAALTIGMVVVPDNSMNRDVLIV